jgi:hypothetical protein
MQHHPNPNSNQHSYQLAPQAKILMIELTAKGWIASLYPLVIRSIAACALPFSIEPTSFMTNTTAQHHAPTEAANKAHRNTKTSPHQSYSPTANNTEETQIPLSARIPNTNAADITKISSLIKSFRPYTFLNRSYSGALLLYIPLYIPMLLNRSYSGALTLQHSKIWTNCYCSAIHYVVENVVKIEAIVVP